jgi:hypothetical protein
MRPKWPSWAKRRAWWFGEQRQIPVIARGEHRDHPEVGLAGQKSESACSSRWLRRPKLAVHPILVRRLGSGWTRRDGAGDV